MVTRITIEVSPEQKQQMKALAALKGLSIKDYILKQSLVELDAVRPEPSEDPWAELRAFLAPRIEAAERGEYVLQSFDEIIAEVDAEFEE